MLTGQERWLAEVEIGALVQRYGLAVDVGGGPALAACFTDDGFVEISSGVRRDKAAMAAPPAPSDVTRRHFFTPPVVTFTGDDTAAGEGYCLILESYASTGERPPPFSVDYRDVYRRTEAGWRLAERYITRSFG
jgi:hypothetical protein